MCVLCFRVVVCCAVSLCVVLVLVLVRNVYCVCVRWCVLSVCGAAWHAEKPPDSVCRFKTLPATCARFASTHGSVLNLHTETFSTCTRGGGKGSGERGSLLSPSLFPSLTFSLSSVVLLLFSLSLLSFSSPSLVFSLSSQ